jgi:apolipoprotein N-acyltransferase
MSPRDVTLALLFTIVALVLVRVSKNRKISHGTMVLLELCLGLVSVGASVFWLKVFALAWG